jgi:hypothetical protein
LKIARQKQVLMGSIFFYEFYALSLGSSSLTLELPSSISHLQAYCLFPPFFQGISKQEDSILFKSFQCRKLDLVASGLGYSGYVINRSVFCAICRRAGGEFSIKSVKRSITNG